jgi:D-3-phosphoglycerate dehydrogenase
MEIPGARLQNGFGCTVLAYDKFKTGFGNASVIESTMEALFDSCDIVSLHIPLTAETRYLVNSDFIARFKKPFYLINTSRGQCVNTDDLTRAIKAGQVRGVCLDVLEYERSSFESLGTGASSLPEPLKYLIASEAAVLSPHIAGWTHESNYKMSLLVAERMLKAFAGF